MRNPIELERFVQSEHGESFWKFYKDDQYGAFFRRTPKTWTKSDLMKFEELTGSQLFSCKLEGTEEVGFITISNICWYGLNASVGVCLFDKFQDETRNDHKYAFWCLLALARLFFDKMNLKKMSTLFLKIRTDIEKSLFRGGFRKEGDFIKNILYEGNLEDELIYVLDKETYDLLYK